MKTVKLLGLVSILFAIPVTAGSAGNWFLHKFGELRSYHSDWLNVCSENGKGQCRAVQLSLASGQDTFFGESRLAVLRTGPAQYVLEIYDQGMPVLNSGSVTFDFGAENIELTPTQWHVGGYQVSNLLETFTIDEPALTQRLIRLIRQKSRLKVTYPMTDGSVGEARFSLRGSSAALDAIERHINSR